MPDYAIYGIHFYGTARYGRPPTFDFALDYFVAKPVTYDRIKVEWQTPSGAWDRLRLVRGNYGFPTTENDGRILLEGAVDDATATSLGIPRAPQTFEDTAVNELRFYYYSIFLHQISTGSWVRAGNAPCLMTKDYGSGDRLYELIPQVFRDDDTIFLSSATGTGMLEAFLDAIGYQVDILRSELESLMWTADPEKMSGGLLPVLAAELGWPYESELGMALGRRQLLNATYLYKMKGTRLGVEGAVSVLTGWAPTVVADTATHLNITLAADRVNRVINPGAETDASGWTGTNATLTRVTTPVRYGTASFQMAVTAAADASMATAAGTAGMPVIPGVLYTASGWNIKPTGTAKNRRIDIRWYNAAGAQLAGAAGTSQGTQTLQVINTWDRPYVSATAPPGAAWASLVATVVAADAGANQIWDAFLFERGGLQTYFDAAIGDPISDYLWEGTANLSRSHYYFRRAIKNSRLVTRLPDFLPAGMTFTPLFAQPL